MGKFRSRLTDFIVTSLCLAALLVTTQAATCSIQQQLCQSLEFQATACRQVESVCTNWFNEVNSSSPSKTFLRTSPWNVSCYSGKNFCPTSSECIDSSSSCSELSENTGSTTANLTQTPWGTNCSAGEYFCNLYGNCIPFYVKCSLQELSIWLGRGNNSYKYFTGFCGAGEEFCPGTGSCHGLNQVNCTYSGALNVLVGNGSSLCNPNQTFCAGERVCKDLGTNCTSSAFSHDISGLENATGWKFFCQQREYICPRIIWSALQCRKNAIYPVSGCTIPCSATPNSNCTCLAGQYLCPSKGGCISNATACETNSTSVCSSTTIQVTPSATATVSSSPVPGPQDQVTGSCFNTCPSGFTYCLASGTCFSDGFECKASGPFCNSGLKYCNVSDSCISSSSVCGTSPSTATNSYSMTPSMTSYVSSTPVSSASSISASQVSTSPLVSSSGSSSLVSVSTSMDFVSSSSVAAPLAATSVYSTSLSPAAASQSVSSSSVGTSQSASTLIQAATPSSSVGTSQSASTVVQTSSSTSPIAASQSGSTVVQTASTSPVTASQSASTSVQSASASQVVASQSASTSVQSSSASPVVASQSASTSVQSSSASPVVASQSASVSVQSSSASPVVASQSASVSVQSASSSPVVASQSASASVQSTSSSGVAVSQSSSPVASQSASTSVQSAAVSVAASQSSSPVASQSASASVQSTSAAAVAVSQSSSQVASHSASTSVQSAAVSVAASQSSSQVASQSASTSVQSASVSVAASQSSSQVASQSASTSVQSASVSVAASQSSSPVVASQSVSASVQSASSSPVIASQSASTSVQSSSASPVVASQSVSASVQSASSSPVIASQSASTSVQSSSASPVVASQSISASVQSASSSPVIASQSASASVQSSSSPVGASQSSSPVVASQSASTSVVTVPQSSPLSVAPQSASSSLESVVATPGGMSVASGSVSSSIQLSASPTFVPVSSGTPSGSVVLSSSDHALPLTTSKISISLSPSQATASQAMTSSISAKPVNCMRNLTLLETSNGDSVLSDSKEGYLSGCVYAVSSNCQNLTSISTKESKGKFEVIQQIRIDNAFLIGSSTKLKIALSTSHGSCRLQLRAASGAPGTRINATGNPVIGYLTIVKLSATLPPQPYIASSINEVRLNESSSKCVNLSDYFTLSSVRNLSSQVKDADKPYIHADAYSQYITVLRNYNKCSATGVTVLSVDSSRGTWNVVPKINTPNQARVHACYTPEKDYSGCAVLQYQSCLSCGSGCIKGRTFSLRFCIDGINDRPTINRKHAYLPPIKSGSNSSFDVASFTSSAVNVTVNGLLAARQTTSDVDMEARGIAIFQTYNQQGSWHYKYAGSNTWNPFNVTNLPPYGKPNSCMMMHLFKPNDHIRFILTTTTLNTCNSYQSSFLYYAWDASDGRNSGVYNICTTANGISNTAFSLERGLAVQLMEDCHGNVGGNAVLDQCGVCGGDNSSCCNGNSTIKRDQCGKCNINGVAMLDCAGQCGLYVRNSTTCNICQPINSITNYKDCNGDCFGNATMSSCNVCVGGNTTRSLNHGKDSCGVCSGNNSTCTDCSGVINGKKKKDLCGACLLPTDPLYNNNCTRLTTVSPSLVTNTSGNQIKVYGAGLKYLVVSQCLFKMNSSNASATSVTKVSSGSSVVALMLVMPSLPLGTYSIMCTFNASGNSSGVSYNAVDAVRVYNHSAVGISHSMPAHIAMRTAGTIYLWGSNFVNSSTIRCLGNKPNVSLVGTYMNSSVVKCHVTSSSFNSSVNLRISVSFSLSDRSYNSKSSVPLEVFAPGASVVSAIFSCHFIRLRLSLPSTIAQPHGNCSHIFSGSLSSLGSMAWCELSSSTELVVYLKGSPTIKPGDTLTVKLDSLKRKGQEVTRHTSASIVVNVMEPTGGIPAVAVLTGPSTTGPCGNLHFRADQSYACCGRARIFKWSIAWHHTVNTSNLNSGQTAAYNSISKILDGISSTTSTADITFNSSMVGLRFVISVNVSFFNGKSSKASLVAGWSSEKFPVLNAFNHRSINIRAANEYYFEAKATPLSCRDTTVHKNSALLYQWCTRPSPRSMIDGRHRLLHVPAGFYQGGKIYTIKTQVSHNADPSKVSTSSLSLSVVASDLVAVIEGGSTQMIADGRNYTAKACRSYDPDKVNLPMSYHWRLLTEDNKPVIHRDSAGVRRAVSLEAKSIVTIDSKFLMVNKKYRLRLTCRKGTRSSTAETLLQVKTGALPQIRISPPAMKYINPSDGLVIEAYVEHDNGFSYVWSAETGDRYTAIDLSSSSFVEGSNQGRANGSVSVSKDTSLKIKKGVLKQGVMYKFTIKAACNSWSSSSSIVFSTRESISGGKLIVSPASGQALLTQFTFTASGFSSGLNGNQLRYQFGCEGSTGQSQKTVYLTSLGFDKNVVGVILSAGSSESRRCFVRAVDMYGGSSIAYKTINVTRVNVLDSLIKSTTDKIIASFHAGRILKASGHTDALFGSSNDCSSTNKTNIKDSQVMITEKIILEYQLKSYPGQLLDVALSSLRASTGCASRFELNKVEAFATAVAEMAGYRSTKSVIKTPMEMSTGYNILTIADQLPGDNFTPRGLRTRKKISNAVEAVVQRMGSNRYLKVNPVAVMTSKTYVQWRLIEISDLRNNIDFKPEQTNMFSSVWINFGTSFSHIKPVWPCTTCQSCTGVSVALGQFSADFLSSSKVNNRVSNVIGVMVLNPKTSDRLKEGENHNITIRLTAKMNITGQYRCHRWNSSSNSWESANVYTSNSSNLVTCVVQRLGFVTVLDVPKTTLSPVVSSSVAPSPSVTSTGVQATSTMSPRVTTSFAVSPSSASSRRTISSSSIIPAGTVAVDCEMKCNSCPCTANDVRNAAFQKKHQDALTKQLVDSQQVPNNRLKVSNVECGSIVYKFQIISGGSGAPSPDVLAARIESAVKNGTVILIVDGKSVPIANDSFTARVVYITTIAPKTTVGPTKNKLSGGEIAGIVIGVLLAIVIIAMLIYMFVFRKNTKKNPQVEPNDNLLEMQNKHGHVNSGYAESL